MSPDCVFCSIISGTTPGRFVYRDDDYVVLEDIAPQAPHHYLIIPVPHIPTIMEFDAAGTAPSGRVFEIAKKIAVERGFADAGFRLVANCNSDGGQTVWHLHFHLLAGRAMSWPPG